MKACNDLDGITKDENRITKIMVIIYLFNPNIYCIFEV